MRACFIVVLLVECLWLSNRELQAETVTLDEIVEKSLARVKRVQCGVIEYERTRHNAKDVSGHPSKIENDGIPLFVHFAWESERRAVYEVPVGRPDLFGSLYVYDGFATVIGGLYDFETAGIAGRNALIMEGRQQTVRNYGDFYLSAAFQLPISDAARADYMDGWWFPNCVTRMQLAHEKGDAKRIYHVLDQPEMIAGSSCVVVELEGFDRVCLDPTLGWAIRRRTRWNSPDNPRPLSRTENEDFRELEPGLWAPYRIHVETGCSGANICYETTMVVRDLRLNRVEDADFRIKLRSGAVVADEQSGKSMIYRETFGDVSIEQLTREARRYFRPATWDTIVIGTVLATLAATVVFTFWWRRRRLI